MESAARPQTYVFSPSHPHIRKTNPSPSHLLHPLTINSPLPPPNRTKLTFHPEKTAPLRKRHPSPQNHLRGLDLRSNRRPPEHRHRRPKRPPRRFPPHGQRLPGQHRHQHQESPDERPLQRNSERGTVQLDDSWVGGGYGARWTLW